MKQGITFSPVVDLEIRGLVDELTEKGKVTISLEPCHVCSTPLNSVILATSVGLVQHLACPKCQERNIIPVNG